MKHIEGQIEGWKDRGMHEQHDRQGDEKMDRGIDKSIHLYIDEGWKDSKIDRGKDKQID